MNINKLIKRLKDELGLSRYLKLSYSDHDLYKIITEHVIPDYSRYFKVEVEVGNIQLLDRIGPDIFLIPDWVIRKIEASNLRMEDIRSIRFDNTMEYKYGGLGNTMAYRMDRLSMANAYAGLAEMRKVGGSDIYHNYVNSCHFEHPNRLRFLWNDSSRVRQSATISLYVNVANNLFGLDVGREHTFYDLAKYTMMNILYNNEGKYIENIASGMGNIELKIEEWQQAGEKKAELLQKMYNDSILRQNTTKVI